VPPGTAVTDSATLVGTAVSKATGTVTYDVYSDSTCTTAVYSGPAEKIIPPGMPPSSAAEAFPIGTYYWQATYSGGGDLAGSMSPCGSEIETVSPPPPPPGPPNVTDVIQVETSPLFDGKTVIISSPQLAAACAGLTFETLQGGSVSAPTVSPDLISVVLDADGNVTVVLDGYNCPPGKYTVVATMAGTTIVARTTLIINPPQMTFPDQVVGYPANEVETGNTLASGNSDVYTVFSVETSPGYAERTARISSPELLKNCGEGSRWESNSHSSPFVNSQSATGIIDDDGNVDFVFKGASCAAGSWKVNVHVNGTGTSYTTWYSIDPPAVTYTGPKNHMFISASPNPVIAVGQEP
jgi:hypothetical protein